MLTKKQKELLIDLIDGYFYPRDLIKDYEKFLMTTPGEVVVKELTLILHGQI